MLPHLLYLLYALGPVWFHIVSMIEDSRLQLRNTISLVEYPTSYSFALFPERATWLFLAQLVIESP
jgi:hypothetical protein